MDVFDHKIGRVFSKWVLEPRGLSTRQHMALVHANEPVMIAKIPSFIQDFAGAELGFTASAKLLLVVQFQLPWMVTSPGAITMVVVSTVAEKPTNDGTLPPQDRKYFLTCCSEFYKVDRN